MSSSMDTDSDSGSSAAPGAGSARLLGSGIKQGYTVHQSSSEGVFITDLTFSEPPSPEHLNGEANLPRDFFSYTTLTSMEQIGEAKKRKRKLGQKYQLYPGENEGGDQNAAKKKSSKNNSLLHGVPPPASMSLPKGTSIFTRKMPPKVPSKKEAKELVVDPLTLEESQLIEVLDENSVYCPARVSKVHNIINNQSQKIMTSFTVTYIGWGEDFDETIFCPTNRIMPMATYTYKMKVWVNFGKPVEFWPCHVTVRRPIAADEGDTKRRDSVKHLEEQVRIFVEPCGPADMDPVKKMSGGFWFPTAKITPFEKDKSKKINASLSKTKTSAVFKKALEEINKSSMCNFMFTFDGSRESNEESERKVYEAEKTKIKKQRQQQSATEGRLSFGQQSSCSSRSGTSNVSKLNNDQKQHLDEKKPKNRLTSTLASNILNYNFDFPSNHIDAKDALNEDSISKIVYDLCQRKSAYISSTESNGESIHGDGLDGLLSRSGPDQLDGGVLNDFDLSLFRSDITEDNYDKFYLS